MKNLLPTLALLSLFASAPAFRGAFVLTVDTSYDINSDHVKSVTSFEYYRSAFEGDNYQYFAVQALTPFWENWTAETGLDSWSNTAEVSADANVITRCSRFSGLTARREPSSRTKQLRALACAYRNGVWSPSGKAGTTSSSSWR